MSSSAQSGDRWAGIVLVVAPLLSVFAMAHHPSAHGATAAERLAAMMRIGGLGALVHGALIALVLAVFVALLSFAGRLGWTLGRVRAGAVAYGAGAVCLLGAALVNGFVVPALAERYVDAAPAEIEAATPVFHLAHVANQALARAGVVAMSAGIFLWSLVAFFRGDRFLRGVGVWGLVVGLLPVVGLLSGELRLDVRGMGGVVVLQAVWQIAAGLWLLLARRPETP